MTPDELKTFVQNIVKDANTLKNKYINQKDTSVNYACVFCHSADEYESLKQVATSLGTILEETDKGPLIHLEPSLTTVAGELKILKIRMPFNNRPERGDADFTINDFDKFKDAVLKQPNFNLIQKDGFEMVELYDPKYDVLVYFSNPPIDKQYKL